MTYNNQKLGPFNTPCYCRLLLWQIPNDGLDGVHYNKSWLSWLVFTSHGVGVGVIVEAIVRVIRDLMQYCYSLDHKRWRHKQNQCSSDYVSFIFTRSRRSTPSLTPSLWLPRWWKPCRLKLATTNNLSVCINTAITTDKLTSEWLHKFISPGVIKDEFCLHYTTKHTQRLRHECVG